MAKKVKVYEEDQKQFINDFNKLAERHSSWDIWCDFVTMTAISFSNSVEHRSEVKEKREEEYNRTAAKYNESEIEMMRKLLTDTVDALEGDPNQDFLGTIYMKLDLGNRQRGQVFTPFHIAELMAMMIMCGHIPGEIVEQGFSTLHDCCCGAGCLLIAGASVCRNNLNVNYQQKVLFTAQDIDPIVAKACYIQLTLLGCPGYVVIGDAYKSSGSY